MMKRFTVLTLVMFTLMLTSMSKAGYSIYRFSVYTGSDNQTNPDIDGDLVVWQSSDTDIYWKQIDASSANAILIGGEQVEPKVSNGIIVWQDKSDSDYDIHGYDTVGQADLTVTQQDGATQREPDISGTIVAYRDNFFGPYNIYTHPIDGTSTQVAAVDVTQYEFSIDGTIVAWVELISGTPQIMVRDMNTTDIPLQITAGGNWHRNPAVSGSVIVWDEDSGDGTYDIYGYDLDDPVTGIFAICTDAGSQKYPAISENIVAWQDDSDGNIWAIDLLDTASGSFMVSDDTGLNQQPAISGNTIVWQQQSSNWNIAGARLLEPSTVTLTSPNGGESVEAATPMTITWTSTGPVEEILIEFSSDGGANWADVNTVANTGNYLWDPIADVDSADCWIRITNSNDGIATDTSDAAFEIFQIPNSITVMDPAGGEQYLADKSSMDINWTSVGDITDVTIEFSEDGLNWQQVVATTPNDGLYTWNIVPNLDSQTCHIRISDVADVETKGLSSVFTIFQCDSDLTADLTGDCVVNLADLAELSRQWLTCGNPYDPAWCFE